MTVQRVYLSSALATGATVYLDDRARHHLLNVLRLKQGSIITVFNGEGGEYTATLINTGKKAEIEINQFHSITRESPLQTHLYQGISRGERMDYTVQKAAELGVSEITPVFTTRTVVNIPKHKIEKRVDHWQNIVISACEQSGRTQIPTVHLPVSFSQLLKQFQSDTRHSNFVFDMDAAIDFKTTLQTDRNQTFNFLIGPEGGLDAQEIEACVTAGFLNNRLGLRTFRTETAGAVVLAILQFCKGDLGTPE